MADGPQAWDLFTIVLVVGSVWALRAFLSLSFRNTLVSRVGLNSRRRRRRRWKFFSSVRNIARFLMGFPEQGREQRFLFLCRKLREKRDAAGLGKVWRLDRNENDVKITRFYPLSSTVRLCTKESLFWATYMSFSKEIICLIYDNIIRLSLAKRRVNIYG